MQITFERMNQNQNVDNSSKLPHSERTAKGTIYNRMGYKIDISGAVLDNKAYGGQKKTVEDVRMDASFKDVTLERNYMAVMSSSMSGEDFAKLQEEGYQIGNIDAESFVTVVDKMKAAMAEGGQIIVGYNDNLSTRELEQITGDISLAVSISKKFTEHNIPVTKENVKGTLEAVRKAMEIPPVSDGSLKYIISNEQSPTIENMYLAGYKSVAADKTQAKGYFKDDLEGYYGKKADDMDVDKLTSQIEKVIADAGLVIDEATIQEGKWIVENGLVLTTDSLRMVHDVKSLSFPLKPDQIISSVASAIAEGKKPQQANLVKSDDVYTQAVKIKEAVANITDDGIKTVIKNGQKLTIENLENASQAPESMEEENPKFATAKRQLEEIRLIMTTQANVRLLKSGFIVDTAPLQEVVEQLKKIEEETSKVLFQCDSYEDAKIRQNFYEDTLYKREAIKEAPIDVVAKYAFLQRNVTLQDVYEKGQNLKNEYLEAGKAYESMMTTPRRDLGDSMSKAFRNIDFLLTDMDLATSESNRRAVRILAYNQMPVNKESVAIIKSADATLNRVVEKLTPANTLYMVRDGVNPLDLTLEELYDYLNQIPQTKESEAEKFSKFIYKLEKKKEITAEEKEACIGIFRLIRQVEKGDFQALGAVVDSNQSLSLMNLLKAVRTKKDGHIDKNIDDQFFTQTAQRKSENLITDQINNYYEKKIDEIYEKIEPEKLLQMSIDDSSTVDQLAEAMEFGQLDEEIEQDYQKQNLKEIRQIAQVSDETISEILDGKVAVTANALMAAEYLKNYRGVTVRKLDSLARQVDESTNRIATDKPLFEDEWNQSVDQLYENLDDGKKTSENYETFLETSKNLLTEAVMLTGSGVMDMQSIVTYMRQMQYLSDMGKEENYEIPISIGDEITSVNLRVIRGKENTGQVSISLQTYELSHVFASFYLDKEGVKGLVTSGSKDGMELLKKSHNTFEEYLAKTMGRNVSIKYVQTSKNNIRPENFITDNKDHVNTNELYKIAKGFLFALKEGTDYESKL